MLRLSNDNILDLLHRLGRASIIMYSYHPKPHEIDLAVYAYKERLEAFIKNGKLTLGDDPFLLHADHSYAQVISNLSDYMGLRAEKLGDDTFKITKRLPNDVD